jgi:hypothetical protein
MTDMQTSLPLLIVRPSILNPVMYFSTQPLTDEWNALGHTFALRIPFHLLRCWCNAYTNQSPNDMIYFILSRDHIDSSILTLLALHCCISPSAPSLAQASPSHAVPCFKASDLPFTLTTGPSSQASSWSSPLWSHDSMSCLICNKLLHHHMYKICNISKPFLHPWHMLLTHMYMWTNHLCISHKTQLVHQSC